MKRKLLFAVLCIAMAVQAFAEANYVYHEKTTNNPGCGPNYVTNTSPTSADAYALSFKIEYQFYTNQAYVYYTTDGSTPAGSFGVGSGTTQVITAAYNCTFSSGGTVDVATATIPAQTAGITVKYIVSAWNSGGGSEIFGNGPGSPCNCGTPTNSSALATVFSYTVSAVLPISFGSVTATQKSNDNIVVDWQVLTQSNIVDYEIQKSADGVSFSDVALQTNTNASQYNWIDSHPNNGSNFYRIKAIGKDGDVTYSSVVILNANNIQASFNAYPNPVLNNSIHLQLNNLPSGSYKINIYNATGQAIYTSDIEYTGGSSSINIIPSTNLAKGIYQLSAKSSQSNYQVKLAVQ